MKVFESYEYRDPALVAEQREERLAREAKKKRKLRAEEVEKMLKNEPKRITEPANDTGAKVPPSPRRDT